MDAIAFWLPLVWAALIGIAVALYVILDGFDLGLGILFPLEPKENCRDVMMNSVAPFWDGNETWLVLGGGGLLVAFPLAYAVIMPALYLPIIIMLLGARVPRRRLRVPLGREAEPRVLGQRLRLGLDRRHLHAGRRARRLPAGHRGEGQGVRRRLARLVRALPAVHRRGAARRLRAAGGNLARHEDRRARSPRTRGGWAK